VSNIIDPEVGPYSPREDIEAWIKELELMPDSESRHDSIKQAKLWLELQERSSNE